VITAGSAYDVTAAGSDIYATSDQFHFAYKAQSGDFDLRVRVASLTAVNVWSKAGLMARESLDPGSREVSVFATPAARYEFQYRTATGAFVQKMDSVAQVSYPNTWVRLKRAGDVFTSYTSADGVTWAQLGTATLALPGSVFLGMAATSHDVSQSVVAQFRDLGIVDTTTTPPPVTVDTQAPAIAGVLASGSTSSSATISWTTDELSDTQVEFGLTTAYGSTSALDASLLTAHFQGLAGLAASALYHYRVKSRDAAGNLAISGDFTFTTSAPPDISPPTVSISAPANGAMVSGTISVTASVSDDTAVVAVQFKLDGTNLGVEATTSPYSVSWNTTLTVDGAHSLTAVARDATGNAATSTAVPVTVDRLSPTISAVSASQVTSTSASISWSTDERSDTQVEYGVTTVYGSTSALTSLLTAHFQELTGLAAETLYHYRVKSRDAAGNLAVSGDFTFTTLVAQTTLPTQGARAIATFESLGLYWTPPADPGAAGCTVRYRKAGESAWKDGLAMWYDARNNECRGSLVYLSPGTNYDVQFAMPGQAPVAQITANTWSETFPIAQTVNLANGVLSQTLSITQGGTPSGYVLYTVPPGGQTTIDVANAQLNNVTIAASYVIVRGLTLRGAQQHAIVLLDGAHDIVLEDNDISGWGRYSYVNSAGWQIGVDWEDGAAGVFANCSATPGLGRERIIIQRNRIHHPRYGSSSWDWGHSSGPQAVGFRNCGGNNVFRYNEVYSGDEQHYFNDSIGGAENFSATGFPGPDSDIYANIIMNSWEDGLEIEGGGRNVRVWGNYLDRTTTGISSTANHWGPLYIFRNVYNRSRQFSQVPLDSDERIYAFKSGNGGTFGAGRRYVFHNTLLQAPPPSGSVHPLGAGKGISAPNSNSPLTNTVSRNNILHVWQSWEPSISDYGTGNTSNDFDYDLYNGRIEAYQGAQSHGIAGTPVYAEGHGWSSESGGLYALAPTSPGYDRGARLPNFNDDYVGAGPDVGAHEAGSPAMRFGVNAGTMAGEYAGLDVGAPALAGRTTVITAGSAYDVTAAGSDIYATSDQFHFAYKAQSGDFDLRVRVASLTAV
ncbi:MAG TPA: Ig-like domain-containing protein, partial [Gemmatimonadaceae bacterium]